VALPAPEPGLVISYACLRRDQAHEIREQHSAEMIGRADGVVAGFYAISVERKLTNPAVVAISDAAKTDFVVAGSAAASP